MYFNRTTQLGRVHVYLQHRAVVTNLPSSQAPNSSFGGKSCGGGREERIAMKFLFQKIKKKKLKSRDLMIFIRM